MSTYIVTGKKPELNKEPYSWNTISDEIEASNSIDAYSKFKSKYPEYTLVNLPRLYKFN